MHIGFSIEISVLKYISLTYLYISSFKAGEDYIFIEAIAIFTPGSPLRQCVNITIINDPIEEEDESFTVALGASSDSITVVNSSTMVTILRNDCKEIIFTGGMY